MNGNNSGIKIIKQGNVKAKIFKCDYCNCLWEVGEGFYEEDWTIYSIPAYCECPCCGRKTYSVSDLKRSKYVNE